jgi:hypothetical protein
MKCIQLKLEGVSLHSKKKTSTTKIMYIFYLNIEYSSGRMMNLYNSCIENYSNFFEADSDKLS